jgi:putative heme-binding domain-containing protein
MRFGIVAICLGGVALAGLVRPAAAQHATASDIADGERAYRDSCANCHGPDGDLIAGIDFGRGLLRRDYSDADIVSIIVNGIPNTPMPATPGVSEPQAERIVAYLRSMADAGSEQALSGDVARGRQLFTGEGECTDCHAVDGVGSRKGPDLSTIGAQRRAIELEASLLDPASVVQPTARSFEVTLGSGEIVTGRLLNHDTFTVQLLDEEERLRSFNKDELRSYGFSESPMPAYGDRLSRQEIADLVSYLASLRGD